MAELRGIAWAHTRGYVPMVATSQAFSELHPGTEIMWDKRSLWSFGEEPLDGFVREYDLLVYDHPFTGFAAERGWFLPMDEHLPGDFLESQRAQSVGPSYRSYTHGGRLWALPVDAAAQVAASRPDLLERGGFPVPRTWDEMVELARQTRKVAVSFTPMGVLSSFLTLCANQGESPLRREDGRVVSRELGEHVLGQLKTLFSLVGPRCLELSPVGVLHWMSGSDDILYAALLYGYSNYAREGYAPHRLAFHDIPTTEKAGCKGATLGGAGLAISAHSRNLAEALEYATWVASPECQRTLYTFSGGQPGNRVAWEDETTNELTNNFFRNTLDTLDGAYLRPNYAGYTVFQARAGRVLQEFLKVEHEPAEVLEKLDGLYAESHGARSA